MTANYVRDHTCDNNMDLEALSRMRIMKPEVVVVYAFRKSAAITSWFTYFGSPCGNDYGGDGVEAWLEDMIEERKLHMLQAEGFGITGEEWNEDLVVLSTRWKAKDLLKVMIIDACDACILTTMEKL